MAKTDQRPAPHAKARKRRPGLRALAASLPQVTKRAFARRGLRGAELARQWPAIVGSELAGRCRPRRLRFPRPREALDGELVLRVAPAWALEIQHLEGPLLERINSFFGYRAVCRLILQQGPLPDPPTNRRVTETTARAPEPAGAALTAKLSTVADPELRAALERIGRSLEQKQGAQSAGEQKLGKPLEKP
ncbi:DUF721 domain-containing protein [Pelagibius sp.]|uniref:DUF721 domain-containing protein n=1 Tax=Pelagibius sp. TaxID=1931238 RepID=UPI002618798D|nr:DUF721 domain-containing protein [Pelagibius sp.]